MIIIGYLDIYLFMFLLIKLIIIEIFTNIIFKIIIKIYFNYKIHIYKLINIQQHLLLNIYIRIYIRKQIKYKNLNIGYLKYYTLFNFLILKIKLYYKFFFFSKFTLRINIISFK